VVKSPFFFLLWSLKTIGFQKIITLVCQRVLDDTRSIILGDSDNTQTGKLQGLGAFAPPHLIMTVFYTAAVNLAEQIRAMCLNEISVFEVL